MGVTKEQVEASLTSKLNPVHLVSQSIPAATCLFMVTVYCLELQVTENFITLIL